MQTKSNIQLIQEKIAQKQNFQDGLERLMESWNIKDNVFVLKNGKLTEASKGYFEIVSEYDKIEDAIRSVNPVSQGIRIMNNEKFQVGNIHNYIAECEDTSKVLDLDVMSSLY
jgi:hypothetical protein